MASSSSSICPFTLKPIADVSSDDLAVIHHTNLSTACGRCTLSKLISYLHDGARECPLCRTSTVGTVYDGGSAEYISRQVNDESDSCQPMSCDKGRIVSFKYGAVSYHLWVTSDQIALNRISSVMGIDINNLKVRLCGWCTVCCQHRLLTPLPHRSFTKESYFIQVPR